MNIFLVYVRFKRTTITCASFAVQQPGRWELNVSMGVMYVQNVIPVHADRAEEVNTMIEAPGILVAAVIGAAFLIGVLVGEITYWLRRGRR